MCVWGAEALLPLIVARLIVTSRDLHIYRYAVSFFYNFTFSKPLFFVDVMVSKREGRSTKNTLKVIS